MSVTTLALFKAQLNITDATDDALLQHKLDAAEGWIAACTGAAFPAASVPAPMTEAALQLAAHWYENREATLIGVSGVPVPFGVAELLSAFRGAVTGHVA